MFQFKINRNFLTVFKQSFWLGWQVTANWTDPFVFIIYSLLQPLASVLILVFIYKIIMSGNFDTPIFNYIFIGNAFFIFIYRILFGMVWIVILDREQYEMIRYIYISPISFKEYLIARGSILLITSMVAVIVTIAFGMIVFDLNIEFTKVNWLLFLLILILGLISNLALGLILSAISLIIPRHSMTINEGIAGVAFLLCGAIYPLDVLPKTIAWIGISLPFTHWLEAIRRVILSNNFPDMLDVFSDNTLLLLLIISTIIFSSIALLFFNNVVNLARKKGYIDRTTGW